MQLPYRGDTVCRSPDFSACIPEASIVSPTPSPDSPDLILIVDDEPALRSLGERILGRDGFATEVACDGQEGVERFAELVKEDPTAVALVVLDLMMPRMDGAEALRHIHRIRPDQPVLLVSGYGESQLLARLADHRLLADGEGLQFGRLIRFLQKPYSTSQLRSAVAETLGRAP
ncbi:MAG: response regulator [Gemmatimonadales bacterium]|nr:MAG: response regulator [Gemmatimonadales bacterium]